MIKPMQGTPSVKNNHTKEKNIPILSIPLPFVQSILIDFNNIPSLFFILLIPSIEINSFPDLYDPYKD